jgi:hypothetical protein
MEEEKGVLAPESQATQKVREKLRQEWEEQALLITDSALASTIEKIHHWIALNAGHRVTLRKKEIHLFDQNQNAAALSRKVQEIASKIS